MKFITPILPSIALYIIYRNGQNIPIYIKKKTPCKTYEKTCLLTQFLLFINKRNPNHRFSQAFFYCNRIPAGLQRGRISSAGVFPNLLYPWPAVWINLERIYPFKISLINDIASTAQASGGGWHCDRCWNADLVSIFR